MINTLSFIIEILCRLNPLGAGQVFLSDCSNLIEALKIFAHTQLFADKQNHINGIENFWNQAKRHMRKFNGVPKSHFPLFLKECEWRFNNPKPKLQLKQLKQLVKQYMG